MDKISFDSKQEKMIEHVIEVTFDYGLEVLGAIVMLVAGWIVAGWIRRVIRRAMDRVPAMDETLKPFIANLIRYVVLIFVLIAVLNQFGVQTTSMIAVLGAAGLAIGLALQGTLANVASGVMLLFLRPFNVGEYVDAGGIAGTVVEIGLFNTEIKTSAGLFLIVPNKIIWDGPITNFSRNPTRRFDLPIGIGYDDDVDGALALLMGLMTGSTLVFLHALSPKAIAATMKRERVSAVTLVPQLMELLLSGIEQGMDPILTVNEYAPFVMWLIFANTWLVCDDNRWQQSIGLWFQYVASWGIWCSLVSFQRILRRASKSYDVCRFYQRG